VLLPLIAGFDFEGGQVERRKRIWRWNMGRGCPGVPSPFGIGSGEGAPPQKNISFSGLEMRILVHSPAHLSIFFCSVNTSRCRPALRLPTLTFQADCGSIKGAVISAEEGPERYLPWW